MKFWAIVAVQVLVILGIVVVKSATISAGREMLVEIAPVDPRDLFRGDYLVYQLKSLTRITGQAVTGEVFSKGDVVYVPLRVSTQHSQIAKPVMVLDETRRVTTVEPRDGSVYVRGIVTSYTPESPELSVRYSIEEFFIPEGSGRNFTFTNKEAMLRISVGSNGVAMITELYINGVPWREQ